MSRLNRIVFLTAFLAGCGSGDDDDDMMPDAAPMTPDAHIPDYTECSASDQAFVREAHVAIVGRRPLSQDEVNVYAQILAQVTAIDGGDKTRARRVVAEAMTRAPGYVDRWQRHFMDKLLVDRIDAKNQQLCYGVRLVPDDDGALAESVRDLTPQGTTGVEFSMSDLLRSALALDDISPVYRAHLFPLVAHTFDGANVPEVELELARRADFGQTFDHAYLHRDILCLGCHNSEFSVTFDPDPALNRHWAMPGLFEMALYDESQGADPELAHAMFRYRDFVVGNGDSPFGMTGGCGEFDPGFGGPDPAPRDALFGSVRGTNSSVYDTEAALHAGFDSLAANGLMMDAEGMIADPDQAFAWLVAASIVETVWQEVVGFPLTVANYFPRNEAQRDLLTTLTTNFVASRYSLRTLLLDIVSSDYFVRLPPSAACGVGPYNMPNVYDPWVISEEDELRRLNGPGDGVHALSARVLLSSAYAALGWETPSFDLFPRADDFCDGSSCGEISFACNSFGACCAEDLYCDLYGMPPDAQAIADERNFQKGVGVFLKGTEHGFRGLDFQARLEWEDRFGVCEKPSGDPDFVDDLVAAAAGGATVRDVVVALKDRVIGESVVADTSERPALEALFGAALDTPASSVANLENVTRRYCGMLLSTPQFLLGGLAVPDGAATPALTPAEASFDTVCGALAGRGLSEGLTLSCTPGGLTVN
jgi:hypothetical protein